MLGNDKKMLIYFYVEGNEYSTELTFLVTNVSPPPGE